MDIRIMFLRARHGSAIGCLAIKLHRHTEYNHGLVSYQMSVLNPLDRFNRSLARHIALGRLVESPHTVKVPIEPSMYEVSQAVMKDIAHDSSVPTRARQAARRWLRTNEAKLKQSLTNPYDYEEI